MMRRIAAGVAGLAVVLAVGACSSSGGGSSSGGSTNDPIKIMAFGVQSSSSFGFPEAVTAIQGLAKSVNASGGVNGHQLDVITCNDGNDPNLAASCARQAVQSKVAAVIGYYSANGASVDPILAAAKVPYIGASSVPDYTSSIAFPVNGGALIGQVAVTYALGQLGCRKLAAIIDNIPAAQVNTATAAKEFAKFGGQAVTIQLPVTATDFAPAAAQAASAGAKCMVPSFGPAGNISAAKAVASSINSVKLGFIGFGVTPQLISQNATVLEGSIVSSPWVPTGSWRAELTKEMAAISPGQPVSDYAISAWTATSLFVDAAKTTKNVTGSSIILALESHKFQVPSIGTYDATQPGPDPSLPHLYTSTCYIYEVHAGKLVSDPKLPGAVNVGSVINAGG